MVLPSIISSASGQYYGDSKMESMPFSSMQSSSSLSGIPVGAHSGGAGLSLIPPPQIRKDFPETWLWEEINR